jgi:hypothetical protein
MIEDEPRNGSSFATLFARLLSPRLLNLNTSHPTKDIPTKLPSSPPYITSTIALQHAIQRHRPPHLHLPHHGLHLPNPHHALPHPNPHPLSDPHHNIPRNRQKRPRRPTRPRPLLLHHHPLRPYPNNAIRRHQCPNRKPARRNNEHHGSKQPVS